MKTKKAKSCFHGNWEHENAITCDQGLKRVKALWDKEHKPQHTPTPQSNIVDALAIAWGRDDPRIPSIVRAVNCHEELLTSLRNTMMALEDSVLLSKESKENFIMQAKQAIAKAEGKMKLLNKGHASVVHAVSKEEIRYVLQGIYLEETDKGLKATATDGKILATVEDISRECDAKDFPANVIPAIAQNSAKAAIVPTEAFVRAVKSMPKRASLPIIENVAVMLGETETTLGTTDLDSPNVMTTKNINGQFPNYNQAIPTAKPSLEICFAPELMMKACKIAKEFGLFSMKMEFTGPLNPVKITGSKNGQDLTIVLMPMRV